MTTIGITATIYATPSLPAYNTSFFWALLFSNHALPVGS